MNHGLLLNQKAFFSSMLSPFPLSSFKVPFCCPYSILTSTMKAGFTALLLFCLLPLAPPNLWLFAFNHPPPLYIPLYVAFPFQSFPLIFILEMVFCNFDFPLFLITESYSPQRHFINRNLPLSYSLPSILKPFPTSPLAVIEDCKRARIFSFPCSSSCR